MLWCWSAIVLAILSLRYLPWLIEIQKTSLSKAEISQREEVDQDADVKIKESYGNLV